MATVYSRFPVSELQRRLRPCLMAALAVVAGCSSNLSTKAGSISVTDPSGAIAGQLASLTVSAKAKVSMTPIHDTTGGGVDWTVICGGSPVTGSVTGGACGTFSPAHTADGVASLYTAPTTIPIGTTVTIRAAVTSDPSATSSATLTIQPPPLAISFQTAPPASLLEGNSVSLQVRLANDTTGAGVSWTASCGSAAPGACGSFNPSNGVNTTYTAPAAVPPSGGTVTVTATSVADPTKSVSASLVITAPAVVDIHLVSPTTFTLGASGPGNSETASLIAVVTGDTTDAGVDWSLSCSAVNCGTLTPAHTASGASVMYTAPRATLSGNATLPVTITAAATATEASGQQAITTSAAATITSAPTISVVVTGAPPSLVVSSPPVTLQAAVTHDTAKAGVSWAVTCGASSTAGCGSVTPISGLTNSVGGYTVAASYTAPTSVPTGGQVTISATPNATSPPSNPGLTGITISAVPSSVTIQQAPTSLMTTMTGTVSAVVNNDPVSTGVTWSVSCGSTAAGACGYIQPYQTASGGTAVFHAPPEPPPAGQGIAAGQVSILASATSSCDAGSTTCLTTSTSAVTVLPATALSINFVPLAPTQLQEASSVQLNAAVANDATNGGVDWQVCADGCGFFTITPEIPAVPATAKTPYIPAVPAVTATTVQGWPNGGPIVYTAPASIPTSGAITITVTAHATDVPPATPVSNVTSVNIVPGDTGPVLQGVVQAGNLPVSGSQVALYAAGTSGYGSASSLINQAGGSAYAVTDAKGSFQLPAGYSCPQANNQMYLLAIGGKAGSNPSNGSLALMAALGPCAALSSTPVVINEVTTVASAWALARFAADPLTTGLTSYLNIGSSSGNASGLANAFASVNDLVDITTGQARYTVPAGNASVPYVEINTLADVLDVCAASGGGMAGDGSPCGTLFVSANPYQNFSGLVYSGVPADTLQAVMEVVQHPVPSLEYEITITGVGGLFSLASNASPFQPILNAAPNDFSLSLNFTGGGLSNKGGSNSLALDASGNLWITNTATNNVIEWNNQGAAITPAGGYTTSTLVSPGPIAIDAAGNAWICGNNGLTELNFVGKELTGSPFAGGGLSASGCLNLAIDGLGQIWTTNSNSVSKFDNLGNPISPSTGYTIPVSPSDPPTVSVLAPIAFDKSNNVWVGAGNVPSNTQQLFLGELNNASGLPNFLSPNPLQGGGPSNLVDTTSPLGQQQIAVDGSGNVWVPVGGTVGGLEKIPPYGGLGTTDQGVSGFNTGGSASQPFANPNGVAVDGAGKVWVANASATGSNTPPNLTEIDPGNSSSSSEFISSSLSNGPVSVSVDSSGNVWVLLQNNSVTEFVGLATPAVTPQSVAVKNKQLGAKP